MLAVGLTPPTTADDDLEKLQKDDPDLIIVRDWITQRSRPERPPVGASPVLAHLWRNFSSLELGDGLLCRRWHDPDPSQPSCFQVVVPFGHRASILTNYHDECGHMGEEKTLLRLRSRFHWYGMRRDVVDWVRSCSSCSTHKTPKRRGRGAPLVSTWYGYPWERVAMDLIPNLPVTKHGNRHLLVVVDYFTKWAEASPLPDMRVETIAPVFLGEIVARYGAPCSMHTDPHRDSQLQVWSA